MELKIMNRREFSKWMFALLSIASISACTFPVVRNSIYMETVSSVLISADGTKLVVITNRFHYIFNIQPTFAQAIKGNFHEFLQATFSDFHVDPNGKITGHVTLILSMAPSEAMEEAINAGFSKTKTPNSAILETALNGERYSPGAIKISNKYRLNRTYNIQITSEQPDDKVTITPLTLVGGVLAVAGVTLFALTLITICAVTGNLNNCHE
jgi:hypothetical protein